jgi:hypothetical protein
MSDTGNWNKLLIRKILRILPFLFLLWMHSGFASAQDDLSDSTISERLRIVEKILSEGKPDGNRWWYGWLVGYSAATIVQGTVAFISEEKCTRQDMALGATTTFLGAAGQILTPMIPAKAPDRLSLIPERTREERITKLTEAERLLKESAMMEMKGRSWKTHALYSVVNLGSGLITWKCFDRSIWAGVENFALNSVITELQIFTQPTRAMKAYKNYQKNCAAGPEQSYLPNDSYWTAHVYPGGIVICFIF